ncbi:hypothetical protein NXS19_012069 [Fusarium pseudograminearum]|uniref:Uncharacterized protein n=1 Tax=Fusarium pseudograminearum (strain CS3096) TaxID=1028729 RepID=K3UWR3_FUSPC|nr:hypothetical protein FPSE_02765 [Fusarium pseudograminearum CS3096]EKJ77121.1 hypothetical protein FPSE_02765 [Fusarium pseudograminearum CS3096]KAF0638419.1 hypothetical protein FPSE5266_02765 [Fusarium pseudograminearum]UZP44257.1 hypothetical protein NXS19_012069 [Fusarium pseudograminearum]
MKFQLFTIIALVSAASAGLIKRVDVNIPSMTDAQGNVVVFNAAEVPTRKRRAIAEQQKQQQQQKKKY